MAAGRSKPRHSAAVRLTDAADTLRSVQDEVLQAAQDNRYPDAATFALRLVLEEAVTNAFKHGSSNPGDTVLVEWDANPQRIIISIEDNGDGFDPRGVPDPTTDDRLELPSGRGLLLIRAYMSDVQFNDNGNRITMTYNNPA